MKSLDYIPFTYLIGWSKLNVWYYGVRWCKKCNPAQLWVSYFTSSKYVNEFKQINGNPDIIQIRKTFSNSKAARDWEEKVIRRIKAVQSSNWLNKGNAGHAFCLLTHTDETKKKLSALAKGTTISEQHKQQISKANLGRKHSEESKQKIRIARLNQVNVGVAWSKTPFTEERRREFSERSYANYIRPGLNELKTLVFELKKEIKFNRITSNMSQHKLSSIIDIIYQEYTRIFDINLTKPNTVIELYDFRDMIFSEIRPTRNWHLLASNEYIFNKIEELQIYVSKLKELHSTNAVWR